MSRRLPDGTVLLEVEGDDECELCGAFDELRPYGPHGERICYDCGEKNPEVTRRMMGRVLFGEDVH